jgi:hypothetical protein
MLIPLLLPYIEYGLFSVVGDCKAIACSFLMLLIQPAGELVDMRFIVVIAVFSISRCRGQRSYMISKPRVGVPLMTLPRLRQANLFSLSSAILCVLFMLDPITWQP